MLRACEHGTPLLRPPDTVLTVYCSLNSTRSDGASGFKAMFGLEAQKI